MNKHVWQKRRDNYEAMLVNMAGKKLCEIEIFVKLKLKLGGIKQITNHAQVSKFRWKRRQNIQSRNFRIAILWKYFFKAASRLLTKQKKILTEKKNHRRIKTKLKRKQTNVLKGWKKKIIMIVIMIEVVRLKNVSSSFTNYCIGQCRGECCPFVVIAKLIFEFDFHFFVEANLNSANSTSPAHVYSSYTQVEGGRRLGR